MEMLHFWVIGGDRRQAKLAELLAQDGHQVHTYGLEKAADLGSTVLAADGLKKIGKADCVILPLPVSREKGMLHAPLAERTIQTEEILAAMRPGQLVVGGQMDEDTIMAIRARALRWRDYFTREELTVANAIPTAEGAMQIAMERMPITLHNCRALVVGHGRIGRILADRLRGMGAFVTVAARRYEQLAWAEADGCTPQRLKDLAGWLCGYDVIFNTVPATLLTEELLADLKPGCIIIDVASEPGGVDLEAARELGVEVVWARGLPGKVAPVTAARAIRQTIYYILQEVPV